MRTFTIPGLAGLVALSGFIACADLSALDEDTCGNGVVEVESGEDCDTFPNELCIPPGEKNQCRLTCPIGDDDKRLECPTGWGCGQDEVCRRPDGTFDNYHWIPLEDTPALAVGDIDGDLRADLVSVTTQELVVSFFDSAGAAVESVSRFSAPTPPALGQLTEQGSPDDIVLIAAGLTVLTGGKDRSLPPTAYAPFSVDRPAAKAVIMEAMPVGIDIDDPSLWVGDEVLVVVDGAVRHIDQWNDDVVMNMSGVGVFAGDPQVGALNPEWPCEDLVLPFEGWNTLSLYNPCAYGANFGWNHESNYDAVTLPSDATILGGAMLVDVNLDSLLDVVISALPAGAVPDSDPRFDVLPVVAYGAGDGTFGSVPPPKPPLPPQPGDRQSVWLAIPETPNLPRLDQPAMPLAIGDLNADGIVDFVMQDAVLVSIVGWTAGPGGGQTAYAALVQNEGLLWDRAVIADFNANGFPDVVVGSDDDMGITFYNGTGSGLFNEFWVKTRGYPAHFTVGDFDGDLVLDLAFSETDVQTADGSDPGHALSVVFGSGYGGPGSPVTMGYLANIEQIAAGSMAAYHLDDIDDLLIISRPDDNPESNVSIAALGGSSDRQLLSPFILSTPPPNQLEMAPWSSVVGEFDGNKDHADIATLGVGNNVDMGAFVNAETRLWLLPSSGEATIDSSQDTPSDPLSIEVLAIMGAMAPIDLEKDGIDEVVILAPAYDLSCEVQMCGHVLLARARDSEAGRVFAVEDLGSVPQLYYLALGDPIDGENIGTHIAVGDVDGDQREDILAIAFDVTMEETFSTSIHLFRHEGNGTLAANPINLSDGMVANPTALALANLDGDPEMEIVIATSEYVYRADVHGGALVNLRVMEEVDGGYSVAMGDLTGDGVLDLAVGESGGVSLYRGVAVNP